MRFLITNPKTTLARVYQSGDFSRIDFSEYIQHLTRNLFSSYNIRPDFLELQTNVRDVYFSLETAIPCGLLINELLTNALKHAFPDGSKGKVQVDLSSTDKKYTLLIRDDGVGLPEGLDLDNPETLGLQLIKALVDQLDADYEIQRGIDTTFIFRFKGNKYKRRLPSQGIA